MPDEPEKKPRKWWIQASSHTLSGAPASVPDVEADPENPIADPAQPIAPPEFAAGAPIAGSANDPAPALPPPEPQPPIIAQPPENALEENARETSAGRGATKSAATDEPVLANFGIDPAAEDDFHVEELQPPAPETPITPPEANAPPPPAAAPVTPAAGNAFVEKAAPAPASRRGLIDLHRRLDSLASTPIDTVGIVVVTRCRNPVRRGQVFNLRQAKNLVGSTHNAALHVEGAGVAEHHAVIAFEGRDKPSGFWLYPLACVEVNGIPITDRTPLHSGDRFEISETEMVFLEVRLP